MIAQVIPDGGQGIPLDGRVWVCYNTDRKLERGALWVTCLESATFHARLRPLL
jgi:hypothetical protein